MEALLRGGMEAHFPLQSLETYQTELLLFIQVRSYRLQFSLNNLIFASEAWVEMSWNEPKWAQKSLNVPKLI